jgi:hypothetical protein
MHLPLPLRTKQASLLIILLVFLLSSLACNSIPFLAPVATPTATSTPTPTLTPTRTSTPTVTRTFTPSLTPTQSYLDWPVVLSDSFDDNSHNWYVGSHDDEFLQGVISITGGRYLVDVTAVKGFFWPLIPAVKNLTDFYLTVEVEKTGSANPGYGLVFRDGSGHYYYFAISSDEQSYFFTVFNIDSWNAIIGWTSTSLINAQGSNQLAVLAKGSSFTFFINGEPVDQAEDSTLKTGKVGVGFEMGKAGEQVEIAFDNFEVKAPKIIP